jgi:CheY-like chemotaxis protein
MSAHIAIFNHSESLLTLFRAVLTKLGYNVTTHMQDLTTLDDIKQMRPDLIILGYFHGYIENEIEVIDALRADPDTSLIPIIVLTTGPLRAVTAQEHEDIPYFQVIEKPFDIGNLLEHIREALRPAPQV